MNGTRLSLNTQLQANMRSSTLILFNFFCVCSFCLSSSFCSVSFSNLPVLLLLAIHNSSLSLQNGHNARVCRLCGQFSIILRVESSSQLPAAPETNRNYYNATNNQEYNNPTPYNSYFSVYDDEAEDADLYRDGRFIWTFFFLSCDLLRWVVFRPT